MYSTAILQTVSKKILFIVFYDLWSENQTAETLEEEIQLKNI